MLVTKSIDRWSVPAPPSGHAVVPPVYGLVADRSRHYLVISPTTPPGLDATTHRADRAFTDGLTVTNPNLVGRPQGASSIFPVCFSCGRG